MAANENPPTGPGEDITAPLSFSIIHIDEAAGPEEASRMLREVG
jgi:hypothetical protein